MKFLKLILLVALAIVFNSSTLLASAPLDQHPVRIGIAGLSHSHVVPLLRNMERTDIEIVGIAESDGALAERYAERFGIDRKLLFSSLEEMLDKTSPDGVITFTSIFDHLRVVEACAPRGIHVMVEKPLAVSPEHAYAMADLAREYGIMVLTNYETSWYPSNHFGYRMIRDGKLGELRKIIIYDGHKGPKEIRVNEEFLDWLTDPVLNGGGAVMDFGCYGADLLTWILGGEKPESVYASLKQYKPDVYPKVDDDATIILSYPSMEGVIHASWNWPFNRKDMHVYGNTGYFYQDDATHVRYRLGESSGEQSEHLEPNTIQYTDPFNYFAAAILGNVTVGPTDLAALELNITVVEILDAAKESQRTGCAVSMERYAR